VTSYPLTQKLLLLLLLNNSEQKHKNNKSKETTNKKQTGKTLAISVHQKLRKKSFCSRVIALN